MPNPVIEVNRNELPDLLNRITVNPEYIFSATCQRRTPLYMTYPPVNDLTKGETVHIGDKTSVITRFFIRGGRQRIMLQSKGTERKMIVKRKVNNSPTKHWQSSGGQLSFNPADKGLMLVAGMYNDSAKDMGCGKMVGRHGDWRPWAFICLRTTSEVTYNGIDYRVRG